MSFVSLLLISISLCSVAFGDETRGPPISWKLPAECYDQDGTMSNCMRTAHAGARQCVKQLETDKGFKPCRTDTSYRLSNEVWFEMSFLWHKNLGHCLRKRAHFPLEDLIEERYVEEDDPIEQIYPEEAVPSIPALQCFKKVGQAIAKCNKQIMQKCPKYKRCYNRQDVAAVRGYKDDAAKKQNEALRKCYKKQEEIFSEN